MTGIETRILAMVRGGQTVGPSDVCALFMTESELETYRLNLKQRGVLTDTARAAISKRRREICRKQHRAKVQRAYGS